MECPDQETGASHSTTQKRSLTSETIVLSTPASKRRLVNQEPITSKDTLNSEMRLDSLVSESCLACPEPILNQEEEVLNKQETIVEKMEDLDSMKSELLQVQKEKFELGFWLLNHYYAGTVTQLQGDFAIMGDRELGDFILDCVTWPTNM